MGGSPVVGAHDFSMSLYDGETGGAPVGAPFTYAGVQVVAGEFTLPVGPLSSAQLNTSPLFLAVVVDGITLQRRQRVFPVPFAMRGQAQDDFQTLGSLEVQGSTIALGTVDGLPTGVRVDQRALSHGGSDELIINQSGDFEGGVVVQSGATVQGNLAATGDLTSTNGQVYARNVPQIIFEQDITTTGDLNIVPAGFSGNAWRRLRVEIEGIMDVPAATGGILYVRPNGAATGYGPAAMHWYGQEPGIKWAHEVNGPVPGNNLLPVCNNHYGLSGHVKCSFTMNTRTGMFRLARTTTVFITTTPNCGTMGIGCQYETLMSNAWRNTTDNITTLPMTFANLSAFTGHVTVYSER
jgi:hypothetical protein